MSLHPDVIDIGALGWTAVIKTRSLGGGEATIRWDITGGFNADFGAGVENPAAALESVLMRVEKNRAVSPLDVPALVGVLVGHFQRRAG